MTPRIFWIGDSTVQFNNISTWPQCGMGQVLDLYVRPGIAVYDHARNGRSTKSFYDEGLWAPVEAALCPGDLLLMQFGHNDEKSEDPTRYAAPDQFAANLLAYAHAAQAKGALPVLITPLVRRRFEGGTLVPTHGAYPDAVRLLAAREDLPQVWAPPACKPWAARMPMCCWAPPRGISTTEKGMRGKTSGDFAVVFESRLKLIVKRQSLSGFHQVQKLFLFYQINCPTSMVGIVCP